MAAKNTSYYRESVVGFGIILPLVIAAILLGGSYYYLGEAKSFLQRNQVKFRAYEATQNSLRQLEEQIGKKKDNLAHWESLLGAETSVAVNTNLREIEESVPPEEFIRTSLEPSRTSSGFASASQQASQQVHLATRGTLSATQKAMLRLETELPQMQLQELKIDPSSTSYSALNFQFAYTVWEK